MASLRGHMIGATARWKSTITTEGFKCVAFEVREGRRNPIYSNFEAVSGAPIFNGKKNLRCWNVVVASDGWSEQPEDAADRRDFHL